MFYHALHSWLFSSWDRTTHCQKKDRIQWHKFLYLIFSWFLFPILFTFYHIFYLYLPRYMDIHIYDYARL